MPKAKRKTFTPQKRKEILAAWDKWKGSMSEFCKARGLAVTTLWHWQNAKRGERGGRGDRGTRGHKPAEPQPIRTSLTVNTGGGVQLPPAADTIPYSIRWTWTENGTGMTAGDRCRCLAILACIAEHEPTASVLQCISRIAREIDPPKPKLTGAAT